MFPEFRSLISHLKTKNAHFARLFERHNEIDQKISNMEGNGIFDMHEIERLKKEKLLLKDEIYLILKKASGK